METINNGFCNGNQTGEFILAENATETSKNLIFTKAVHLKDPGLPINYGIKKTGYYCVGSTGFSPDGVQYTATVEFRSRRCHGSTPQVDADVAPAARAINPFVRVWLDE